MPAAKERAKHQDKAVERDLAKTYNEFKEYEGKVYTGMKVGRSHRWHYEAGEWKETKLTPDKWEFTYAVKKRRHGKAPEGSGVPVGTEYHWYILAHQNVRKLDANTYTTAMAGLKYKLAHKRAEKEKWSISDRAQRRHLIKILQEMIADLEEEPGEAAQTTPSYVDGLHRPRRPSKPRRGASMEERAVAAVAGRSRRAPSSGRRQ